MPERGTPCAMARRPRTRSSRLLSASIFGVFAARRHHAARSFRITCWSRQNLHEVSEWGDSQLSASETHFLPPIVHLISDVSGTKTTGRRPSGGPTDTVFAGRVSERH